MVLNYIRKRKRKKQWRLMTCGNNVFIDSTVDIYSSCNMKIGNNVHIQFGCKFFADARGGITIGDGCIFAHDVQILTRNHNYDSDDLEFIPYDQQYIEKPVVIGEYCWIGARATILPGVKIGKGVVIATCTVVTKDIPDYAVVGGNPASIIKYRSKEKFEELLSKDKGYIKCKKNYL